MEARFTTLKNGLRVVTVPMRERDSAAVAIWVRTGGRYESKKLSGASHFLEHMLFKGTQKRSARQIKEEIEGVGGMLNAFTGEEVTCYFSKILRDHYGQALEVLADMVKNATLDPTEYNRERTVILEEIKMYRDLPSQHVHEMMGELLWPKQPLGRPIAGTLETVSAMTRNEVMRYKKKYYHPKNILVSVSGRVDHRDVVLRVRKLFAQNSSKKRSQFRKALSRQSKPRLCFLEKKTEQTHFVIGFHGLPRFHKDRYTLGLLNVILGANMSSRLFEEVREKRGLAYEIRSGLSFYQDTGAVSISAGVEAKKASMAMTVILRELSKLCRTKVGAGELRRAKDYYLSQLCMALEDTLEHVLWLGERFLEREDLPDRIQIRQLIENVSAEDIQKIARQIFKTKNLNFTLIGPVGEKMQKQIRSRFYIPGRP